MRKRLISFWPLILIFIIWFAFSFPYLVKGKTVFPSTYQVNFFPPWSSYPEFWGPVKNGAMPDIVDQIYPWKNFTIQMLKSGQLPFWNPYSFSGTPHIANFQSAVFSPFNLLFFILPFVDAWNLLVLAQPLLAGFFTYLLLRKLNVSKEGSVIGSITFMFCGFIVVWMAYGTMAFAILYLPLALFFVEKFLAKSNILYFLLLSLTVPLSFFSGHFQISLYFLIALMLYAIFRGVTAKEIKKTFALLGAILLGVIFSSPQILPSINLYMQSFRSNLFITVETIPSNYLVTIISPDFFGNPVTRNDWFGHYAEWAGFIGIWPLILGIFAVFKAKDKRILYFAAMGIISLLLSVESPFSSLLVWLKIPVISTSALSRIIVLFSFSFAVLSGFGFDFLKKSVKENKNKKFISVILFITLAILCAIWIGLLLFNILPSPWLAVAKRNFILPSAIFISGFLLVLFNLVSKKKILFLIPLFFVVIISVDSFRFANKWMPSDPKNLVFTDVPIIEGIRKNIGYGRIYGNFGAHLDTYYGFPSIEGYDPLYLKRYGEFISSASSGNFEKPGRSVVLLSRRGKYTDRVLDFLGVNLIFHPKGDTNQGWAYPVWDNNKRFSLAFEDTKFQLFKNNTAMGRAQLFYNFEVIKEDADIIKRFYSDNFDFRNTLILEEDPGIRNSKDGKNQGKAKIVSYLPNKISIEVYTEFPAVLFLSDNFYSNWFARVNEKETKILRADYSFRGVVVPKGKSIVEFIYEGIF